MADVTVGTCWRCDTRLRVSVQEYDVSVGVAWRLQDYRTTGLTLSPTVCQSSGQSSVDCDGKNRMHPAQGGSGWRADNVGGGS